MMANWIIDGAENVFLQDGNTTALSSGRLSDVVIYLRQAFPSIRRITSYGRAENLSKVSAEEFAELKKAGLDRIHSGFETGSDAVLKKINKGRGHRAFGVFHAGGRRKGAHEGKC